MKRELQMQLVEAYPSFFREYGGDWRLTRMADGCAHGNGWFGIVKRLCEAIREECDTDPDARENFRFEQIKQKAGLLRIYHAGGNARIAALIQEAEQESAWVCEDCGATEALVPRPAQGWVPTLCPRCFETRQSRWKRREDEARS